MRTSVATPWWKTAVIGGLSGTVVFVVLMAARAQTIATVSDVRANPKQYVGSSVQVTGLAQGIRTDTKLVKGSKVPYTKLNLYEVDAKGRKGSHYIYVALPTSDFSTTPVEGEMARVTGTLKWPYEVAAIDP